MEVFLFLKAFQQKFVVAGEDVPVEQPEIVPRRVLPVVGELDPAAELHRPPLARIEPRNTRFDTSDRYSSRFRNSESNSGMIGSPSVEHCFETSLPDCDCEWDRR